MDKTGTLTMGRPVVVEILTAPGRDAAEILRLAASVDQMSPHVLAEAIVTEALTRGLALSLPTEVVEEPGRGVTAIIDDHRLQVGKLLGDQIDTCWARVAVNRATLDSLLLSRGFASTGSLSVPYCCETRCAAKHPAPSDGSAPPG